MVGMSFFKRYQVATSASGPRHRAAFSRSPPHQLHSFLSQTQVSLQINGLSVQSPIPSTSPPPHTAPPLLSPPSPSTAQQEPLHSAPPRPRRSQAESNLHISTSPAQPQHQRSHEALTLRSEERR